MIKPNIKPPTRWLPEMFLGGILPHSPRKPLEFAIRNIGKQAIMRALLSSKSEIQGKK